MTHLITRVAFAAAALSLLSACDAPAPATPEPAPEAAAAPPPPQPFNAAQALAAVNPDTLCVLYSRAVSDSKTKIKKSDCAVSSDASHITLATKSGADPITVLLAEPGTTIQLTPANASPRAIASEARGAFSSIGAVFIGKAPASGLCLSVEYFAADESSNSLFVSIDPNADPERFNLKITPEIAVSAYPTPVVPAGQTGAFALTRREEQAEVKSISFKPC